jgi:site-specific recombinase XerD
MRWNRVRLGLKLSDWPDPDRSDFAAALQPGDVFSDPGGGAHWAEATRRRYQSAWGRYLAWLMETSALEPVDHMLERNRPELVQAYVDARRREVASSSVASELECLHNIALCLDSVRDWSWFSTALSRARAVAKLVKAIAPRLVSIQDLWEAAFKQVAWAETCPTARPNRDWAHYRDGVLVGLLCVTLVRRKNLAGLEFGRHIRREAEGWVIAIPGREVKNGIAKDVVLPERLGHILDGYVDAIRPKLLKGRDSQRLWISEAGGDLTPEAIHDQIKKVTSRFAGRAIGPHLFRHCAATSIAEAAPEIAYIIQYVLGHTTSLTSDHHYKRANAIEASRRLGAVILMNSMEVS